jgi:hypothetical protein
VGREEAELKLSRNICMLALKITKGRHIKSIATSDGSPRGQSIVERAQPFFVPNACHPANRPSFHAVRKCGITHRQHTVFVRRFFSRKYAPCRGLKEGVAKNNVDMLGDPAPTAVAAAAGTATWKGRTYP